LVELLEHLPERLRCGTVGEQVGGLVEAHHHLRDLGASIGAALAPHDSQSGRARLIAYLRHQVGRIVHTDELMIVAGINDYPRRIRELRAQEGWPILSGFAARDLRADAAAHGDDRSAPSAMAVDEYLLIEDARDSDAPRRWQLAGDLRRRAASPREAVESLLRAAPERRVSADELRYAAKEQADWVAAVRALRAENWPIFAGVFGDDLPIGLFTYRPQDE